MSRLKKSPWRIILSGVSLLLIGYLWAKKDIADLYAALLPEQVLPLIVTTAAVSVGKVAVWAAGVWGIKKLTGKRKK